MATVKKVVTELNGVSKDIFESKHKPLYHTVLGLNNIDWEKVRERASQKAGNKSSGLFDEIKEKPEIHAGRKKVFDFISKLNAPRIAARILERIPNIHHETGGNFADQLHQLIDPDKYPKM